MTESPQQLDYGRPDLARLARGRRYLIVIATCFGVAWLVWLAIGFATYDPFDDDLLPWLFFVAVMIGTACGVILSAIALVVMALLSRRHGGAS